MFERTEIKDIVAYLRLIANDDDDPAFVRAVTTPQARHRPDDARAPGRRSRAARHDEPVRRRVRRRLAAAVPARQREALDEFCALINGLRHRAEREPAGRLLDELVAAIGYEEWLVSTLDERDAQARSQSVAISSTGSRGRARPTARTCSSSRRWSR